jgi:hypothetical protein
MPSRSARLVIGLRENFPKQAEPAVFGPARMENAALLIDFTRKVPEPKPKTEIQQMWDRLIRSYRSVPCVAPGSLGGHYWNRFTNQRSPVGDGGFADHEAAVNLAVQGGRAVVIEAGHQHGPSLIRKIVGGLT